MSIQRVIVTGINENMHLHNCTFSVHIKLSPSLSGPAEWITHPLKFGIL